MILRKDIKPVKEKIHTSLFFIFCFSPWEQFIAPFADDFLNPSLLFLPLRPFLRLRLALRLAASLFGKFLELFRPHEPA
jgi:hypothetical protein